MDVGVVDARQQRAAVEVDDAGRRPGERLDVGAAAHGGDRVSGDRQGLGDRAVGVDGDDRAVDEDQVGVLAHVVVPQGLGAAGQGSQPGR